MDSFDKYRHSIPITAIIFILSLPIAAFFLRQNNLTMIELRQEVIRIDEQTGDLEQIEPALAELRAFVLSHMNSNMGGPLELPGAYNVAVEQARQAAEESGQANAAIYAAAQQQCEKPDVLLTVRAQCIQDYVTANAVPGTDPQELVFPPKELYSYSFVSPSWSFDLAGMAVLVSAALFIWLIYLVIVQVILSKMGDWINRDPLE